MTYNVFDGTLNLALSIYLSIHCRLRKRRRTLLMMPQQTYSQRRNLCLVRYVLNWTS